LTKEKIFLQKSSHFEECVLNIATVHIKSTPDENMNYYLNNHTIMSHLTMHFCLWKAFVFQTHTHVISYLRAVQH